MAHREEGGLELYTASFCNHDGSQDVMELGAFEDEALAVRTARSALFVSLSAVSVDVRCGDVRVAHVRREAPRFAAPTGVRRFARGMVPV
jgi:hypothetical protein